MIDRSPETELQLLRRQNQELKMRLHKQERQLRTVSHQYHYFMETVSKIKGSSLAECINAELMVDRAL